MHTSIHPSIHTYIHTRYTYPITIIFLLCFHKWPSFPSVSLSPGRRFGSSNLLEGLWPSSGSPSVQCLSPTLVLRRQNKLKMSGTSQAKQIFADFLWTFCGKSQVKWTFVETLWLVEHLNYWSIPVDILYIRILSITKNLCWNLTSFTSFDWPPMIHMYIYIYIIYIYIYIYMQWYSIIYCNTLTSAFFTDETVQIWTSHINNHLFLNDSWRC